MKTTPSSAKARIWRTARGRASYRGTLGENVVTIATLLKDAGYHTYMSGKWHLGKTPELLPSHRGFERTITMADTGADNWKKKPYLPMYKKANWFGDGEEIDLPEDFYSSKSRFKPWTCRCKRLRSTPTNTWASTTKGGLRSESVASRAPKPSV
ncbi:MAG: sulfatase-like hydrolase/transferase [Myxococcales bacterium]|nr:sulfatase-like hydrolase/transferase [Myxococcales bacterium]